MKEGEGRSRFECRKEDVETMQNFELERATAARADTRRYNQ
jgi:hypothetical protein